MQKSVIGRALRGSGERAIVGQHDGLVFGDPEPIGDAGDGRPPGGNGTPLAFLPERLLEAARAVDRQAAGLAHRLLLAWPQSGPSLFLGESLAAR